jgi:NitT/TauT family transport system substrate-binding protein
MRAIKHRGSGRASGPLLLLLTLFLGVACAPTVLAPTEDQAKPTAVAGSPAASPSAAQAATTAPAAASKPAEMKTLRYGATGVSWNLVPEIVATDHGFFTGESLNVETIVAGQSAAVCQQLLAKAVDIGGCSMNDMIQAVEASGAPLVLVMNETVTALQYGLLAKPTIKTWSDLKGKTIMVGGPKDNTVFYIRAMARANGLQDSDYDFQFAGASAARLAALKSGAVDASILSDPFDTTAELDGFSRVDNLLPKYLTGETYAGGGPIVLRDWAKSHDDEVTRYIRAMQKTIAWINNPANKQELFTTVGSKLNLSQDAFDRVYEKTLINAKQWSLDGQIRDSAVQGVVNSLIELGSLKEPAPQAGKYYDASYLELAKTRQ